MIDRMVFNAIFNFFFFFFNYIPGPCFPGDSFTILLPSHQLPSHITIAHAVVSFEEGMNPVKMTITYPLKEIWQVGYRIVLK